MISEKVGSQELVCMSSYGNAKRSRATVGVGGVKSEESEVKVGDPLWVCLKYSAINYGTGTIV